MADYEIFEVCTGDIKMNVTRFGGGEKTFIIIPGLSLKPVSESAEFVAAAYRKACKDYTVYVFDRKKNPEEGYTVRQMAGDTAAVMEKLGIDNAYAFGASQGGMILQFLMIDYPNLIKKAVVGSSMARPTETSEKVLSKWVELSKMRDHRALNHDCFQKIYSKEYLKKYEKHLPALEDVGTDEDCDNFTILAQACVGFSAYEELDKVRCPVLVIGAEGDETVSVKGSEEIAGRIGCELYIYEGSSHAVYDEAPDYLDRILEFFGREN